jgi:hypothetical protein
VAAWETQTRRERLIDASLWASTVGLALITLLFSIAFSPPGTGSFPLADKFGHGLMYFATFFCFLLAAVWRPGRGDGPFPRKGLVFALGTVAVGMAIEVLQELATVHRRAELGDVISEVIGAFGALAILTWMRRARGPATG